MGAATQKRMRGKRGGKPRAVRKCGGEEARITRFTDRKE
jgi:hypothetical protein